MGDNITVSSPIGQVRTMKIVGLFDAGTTAIDEGQAYVLLEARAGPARQARSRQPADRATRRSLAAREVGAKIEERIGYRTESWKEAQRTLCPPC
jgi:lipoprotein-releasing system permease protein